MAISAHSSGQPKTAPSSATIPVVACPKRAARWSITSVSCQGSALRTAPGVLVRAGHALDGDKGAGRQPTRTAAAPTSANHRLSGWPSSGRPAVYAAGSMFWLTRKRLSGSYCLDPRQPLVVVAVACPDPFLALVHHHVDVGAASRERVQGLVVVDGPALDRVSVRRVWINARED